MPSDDRPSAAFGFAAYQQAAAKNIAKLADRAERGVLHGDGDER